MALEAKPALQNDSALHRAEWDAIISADHALCVIQDALFVMEELRQEHDAMWARANMGRHAHRSLQSDLSALDEATGRLVAAQGLGTNCIGHIVQPTHSSEAAEVCATILYKWERTQSRVAAILNELFLDRSFLIVYDVCVQAHHLMDSLETALEQSTAPSPSRTDGYHSIFEARRAHYVPACRRVIDVLNQQKEICALLRPKTQPTLDAVCARWCALEARLDSQAQQVLINSLHSLQLDDIQASREKRRPRDSDPNGSLKSVPLPSTPVLPKLQSIFAPSSEPIPAKSPLNYNHRESMLPRLTPQKPSTESPRFHAPSKRHASYQHIRSTKSMQGLRPRFASSEISNSDAKSSMAYVPDQNDALDIGVARICNAREILIRRIDNGGKHDEYHRYAFPSKTMACRLLYTHIHVRVGGGWLELSSWIDAYIAN
ncbi:hypothetical protein MYAM1_002061 [Malassezia yamatoensis]|uniref:GAR domain-containing protein n=1 Tax=Malassezia yamatoensis TaxID=253288 RepID=A0AAJ5YT62_9BASI|nr:hypothetical protein MYAM1_002061 [Malassezia yamatoensis]